MRKQVGIWIICVILVLAGCASVRIWTSSPSIQKAGNDYFGAEFEPQLKDGQKFFTTFQLIITNKTDKDLQIDWVKTRYLHNGRANGGFGFEGITAKNINNPPPDTVSAGATFSKVIWPVKLVGYRRATDLAQPGKPTFSFGILPEGENGILLIVNQDGKEIREKITLTIAVKEMSP